MKIRFLCFLLVLCMIMTLITVLPIGTNASGGMYYCGNYTWEYVDDTCTLIIGPSETNMLIDYMDLLSFRSRTEKIIIKDGVTHIDGMLFDRFGKVTEISIPDSVISIGDSFSGFSSLTEITIPVGVTSIATNFYDCSNLSNIFVLNDNTAFSSDDGVLLNKDKTAVVKYPEAKKGGYSIPDSVKSIGSFAFYSCKSLKSVTIPDGVTEIGEEAFGYCTSLEDITISESVISIAESAFEGCRSLTGISIPLGTKSITAREFKECTNLTEITIPESVTSIEECAFAGCKSLTKIAIPNGVTSIGDSAFEGCINLARITMPDSITEIGYSVFGGCESLKEIKIPTGVTSIGIGVFAGCSNLASISIPAGVSSIDNFAFYSCTSLKSVTIPDGVEKIGREAFENCTALKEITIPDSVTRIGEKAFYGCSSLTNIRIPDDLESGKNSFFEQNTNASYTIEILPHVTDTPELTVTLNGTVLNGDQPPIIKDSRTLVPLRMIFEALGALVNWDDDTLTVTAEKDGIQIKITIGDNKLYKNSNIIELDVPAQIVNDRTFVPVRAISESFGYQVDWDDENKTVKIYT